MPAARAGRRFGAGALAAAALLACAATLRGDDAGKQFLQTLLDTKVGTLHDDVERLASFTMSGELPDGLTLFLAVRREPAHWRLVLSGVNRIPLVTVVDEKAYCFNPEKNEVISLSYEGLKYYAGLLKDPKQGTPALVFSFLPVASNKKTGSRIVLDLASLLKRGWDQVQVTDMAASPGVPPKKQLTCTSLDAKTGETKGLVARLNMALDMPYEDVVLMITHQDRTATKAGHFSALRPNTEIPDAWFTYPEEAVAQAGIKVLPYSTRYDAKRWRTEEAWKVAVLKARLLLLRETQQRGALLPAVKEPQKSELFKKGAVYGAIPGVGVPAASGDAR